MIQLPLFTTVSSDWRAPDLNSLPSWEGAKRVAIATIVNYNNNGLVAFADVAADSADSDDPANYKKWDRQAERRLGPVIYNRGATTAPLFKETDMSSAMCGAVSLPRPQGSLFATLDELERAASRLPSTAEYSAQVANRSNVVRRLVALTRRIDDAASTIEYNPNRLSE